MSSMRQAQAEVRRVFPALGLDSANTPEGVFAVGCKALGIDLRGIHPSAWEGFFRQALRERRASGRPVAAPVAMDSAGSKSFEEAFPDAARIQVGGW